MAKMSDREKRLTLAIKRVVEAHNAVKGMCKTHPKLRHPFCGLCRLAARIEEADAACTTGQYEGPIQSARKRI